MTVSELRAHMNNLYGTGTWPATHKVDFNTFGQVSKFMFIRAMGFDHTRFTSNGNPVHCIYITVGPHGGIMFKNVELVLEDIP